MNIYRQFTVSTVDQETDLVISAPMISCELLKPSVLPIHITNIGKKKRLLRLCFGCGEIQPMMKSRDVTFGEGDERSVVEFGFIPLAVGEHQLQIWAKEGDERIVPMCPLCLSVQKPPEQ
jgi:hypothetical protein